MTRDEANLKLGQVLAKFRSCVVERDYEVSVEYDFRPGQFDVDAEDLCSRPFEAPHSWRLALRADGEVVFDGVFVDPLPAMELMVAGMKVKIADSSWVDWMATLDESWAPRVA